MATCLSSITVLIQPILLVVLGFWLLTKLKQWYNTWNVASYMKKTFPSPKIHWLFGHLLDNPFEAGFEWMLRAAQEYRRCFVVWVGPFEHFLFILHPDHIRHILTQSEEFSMKAPIYRYLSDWTGDGLICSHGNKWFRHRKLLTNCFHFNILKDHVWVMNRTIDTFVNILDEHAVKKEPLTAMEHMSRLTMDALLRAVCSFESNCQEKKTAIGQTMRKLNDVLTLRWTNPLFSNDLIFFFTPYYWINRKAKQEFLSLQKNVLQEKKKDMNAQKDRKHVDFIDTLLLARDEDGKGLSEEEIIDEMNTFLFAGHDTIASAITYFLYGMAKHPDIQRKVQSEVDGILKDRPDDDILWEDLANLEYVTMCLKESSRCYGMTQNLRITMKDWEVDGKILPKGTNVAIQPYLLHHNPDIWGENHMEFNPERFTKSEIAKRDPFAYLPFSAGQRNCIGQNYAMNEMKVIAARVFKKFNVKLVRDAKILYSVVGRPETEMLFSFTKRFD